MNMGERKDHEADCFGSADEQTFKKFWKSIGLICMFLLSAELQIDIGEIKNKHYYTNGQSTFACTNSQNRG